MTKGRNKWWFSVTLFILLGKRCQAAVPVITYKVPDGVTADSYIGNIGQDAQFQASFDERQFQIVKGDELLQIDSKSGDLRTRTTIDRETVCDREVERCLFNAEIITTPQSMFKLFKVVIEVEDLNDNSPIFPKSIIDVNLSEEAQLGHLLRLDSATDADTAEYGIKSYSIRDGQGYFGLVTQTLSDGSLVPMLKLLRLLDHERQKQHKLTLVAHDGGSLSGETTVIINVLDVNDHPPIFSATEYTISILETVKENTQIFKFNATDEDSEQYGTVHYRYGSLVSANTAALFELDETTGVVTMKGRLDYETKKTHNLYVEARDVADRIGGHLAYTTLIIHVIDVNDNEPVIDVNFIDSKLDEQVITENIQIGSFVAFVSVTDRDNQNERLETKLIDPAGGFELQTVDADSNRFILRTAGKLDRERVSSYDLTIVATDSGNPPKRAEYRFTLSVGDENDNAPYFGQPRYHVTVKEGNQPNHIITRLEASDLDFGNNSQLSYHLTNLIADGQPLDPTGLFAINSTTGQISAVKVFDAEQDAREYVLGIEATDHGQPSKSGNCELIIKIGDINDNAPQWVKDEYHFVVDENNAMNYAVGQVKAIDNDRSDKVTYSFAKSPSRFYIEPNTGVIFLSEQLDYEMDPHEYEYVVNASDGNGRVSGINVRISLSNLNDNAPELTWPHAQSDILHLNANTVKSGMTIATVQASDKDQDSSLSFTIDRADTDLIDINGLTGEMSLRRDIQRNDFGSHLIILRIEDNAIPPKSSEGKINVYITDKSELDEAEYAMLLADFQSAQVAKAETSLTNLAILLMALFSLLLILMVIITASVFLRHRSQRKEVYRCRDRTSRYEPKGRKSPMMPLPRPVSGVSRHSREEIAWPIETLESWNKEEQHSFHSAPPPPTTNNGDNFGVIENNSTVDSGRDSGSARFSTSGSGSEYKAEAKLRPTFSTFVDDDELSDRESMLMCDETMMTPQKTRQTPHQTHLVT